MKWLTRGGVVAALAVGAGVAAGLGWRGVTLLLAFFVSGSLLTRWTGGEGGQRTARQVLANGGVAAVAALAGCWAGAAGALAAATADTWATEIGAFSPRPPRLLTTGTVVAPGSSGGVTLLGTLGGLAGASAVAALAWSLAPPGNPTTVLGVALAGAFGMTVDSLLGATAQGAFACAACDRRFERAGATCHGDLHRIKGFAWLDNDGVNLAATLAGAAVAVGWQSLR